MRYANNCKNLETRQWKALWENNIPDLATLKSQITSRGVVVVDAEPWKIGGRTACREFGIAYIPPIQAFHSDDPGLPKTLTSYQQHYAIKSHCYHIRGRERKEGGPAFAFGEADLVDAEAVQEALLGTTRSFGDTDSPKPILVGFDLAFELRVITAHYPRLTGRFSGWVDAQELAADASGRPEMPSLRDTLIALGFGGDPRAVCGRANRRHCAGNDVVRLAAGLVELMRWAGRSSPPLDIGRSQKKSSKQKNRSRPSLTRKLWRSRPKPYDFYPFTARIYETSEHRALQRIALRALFDYFSSYSPTAAGINSSKTYGWVCLPDHETLGAFVHQFDGTQESGEGYIWKAVAACEKSTTSTAASDASQEHGVCEGNVDHSDGWIGDTSDIFNGLEIFSQEGSTTWD